MKRWVLISSLVLLVQNFAMGVPRTLNVPSPWYPTIGSAISSAANYDTIQIAPGTYRTACGFVIEKAITIKGINPDDPNVVAATIITQEVGPEGSGGVAFLISNSGAKLEGITIKGFGLRGLDGKPVTGFGKHGKPGGNVPGVGILCNGASPTIKNCVISDCVATGGNGSAGAAGGVDPCEPSLLHGGGGGEPGIARGAGLYCTPSTASKPNVINCTFNNCSVIGGRGGDGGDGVQVGEEGPYGLGGHGGGWNDRYSSGFGGAVYVGARAHPTFQSCTFTNNSSYGGMNGISGISIETGSRPEPSTSYKIDTVGGAVYCAEIASADFIDCVFSNNKADPNSTGGPDEFVSFGGAVGFEPGNYDCLVKFKNCRFNGNKATVGGAMFWHDTWRDPEFDGCNFLDNSALHGGGMYFFTSSPKIARSNFSGNEATHEAGQGGGIYCFDADAQITDCDISGNAATGSGGGVYIASWYKPVLLKNCLITHNSANRDGGGVSTDWGSFVEISNCTIADNTVTGSGFPAGYGGGLYTSYESGVSVIDSILWGNSAPYGNQIAVDTYYGMPSAVDVDYSDVEGGAVGVYVGPGCGLSWDTSSNLYGTSLDNPLFVSGDLESRGGSGDYFLNEPEACSFSTSSIAAAEAGPTTFGDTLTADELNNLEMIIFDSPPTPPPGFVRPVAEVIANVLSEGPVAFKVLEVPASRWTYGCAPTAAGMIFGYYDRNGYPKMYTGPANGGLAPLTDLGQGTPPEFPTPISGSCSIIATQRGFDGRTTYGHVDDYWDDYNSPGPDPWEGIRSEHAWDDCTADFMGTSQWKWDFDGDGTRDDCVDGATVGWFNPDGTKLYDFIPPSWAGLPRTELCHGMRLFAESRGYTVPENYTQGIAPRYPGGFSFDDYMAEIDSGNPVMLLLEGHAIVGVGYDTDGQIVYLHDTWDCNDHTMTWGGTYAGMAHKAVAVVHLVPLCYPEPSPCIDAGPKDPNFDALFFGMYRHTTRIDGELDTGPLDIGYHFLLSMDEFGGCDYNFDGIVDLNDLNIFLSHWLQNDCTFPEWCNGTDLNKDGTVNSGDYTIFAGHYKETDTTAPKPNPMTWAVAPRSAGAASITMTATKAYDNSTGSSVEYYFEAYSGGGHSSGWQDDPTYTDTDITVPPGTLCGYRVKARDTAINLNETGWSVVGYAMPGIPLPMEPNNVAAAAISSSQINLSWTDRSDNETGFKIERKTGSGSYSQIATVPANTTTYSNTGLSPLTTYTYRVRAYNASGDSGFSNEASATTLESTPAAPSNLTATAVSSNQINLSWTDNSSNETGFRIERRTGSGSYSEIATVPANTITYSDTGLSSLTTYTYRVLAFNIVGASDYSSEASATTFEGPPPPVVDTTPPLPNPSQWAVGLGPSEYYQAGWYRHRMEAVQADDTTTGGNCPCEYYFDCVSGSGGKDSGWQLSPIYDYPVNPIGPTTCQYKVRTRDAAGNMTEWSSTMSTHPL